MTMRSVLKILFCILAVLCIACFSLISALNFDVSFLYGGF